MRLFFDLTLQDDESGKKMDEGNVIELFVRSSCAKISEIQETNGNLEVEHRNGEKGNHENSDLRRSFDDFSPNEARRKRPRGNAECDGGAVPSFIRRVLFSLDGEVGRVDGVRAPMSCEVFPELSETPGGPQSNPASHPTLSFIRQRFEVEGEEGI